MLFRFQKPIVRSRRFGLLSVLGAIVAAGLLTSCSAGSGEESGSPSAAAVSSAAGTTASPASSETPDSSAQSAASAYPQSFQDEMGHEVTLEAPPETVFAPGMEDSLVVLGFTPAAQWANGNVVPSYLQSKLGDVPKADFAAGLPAPETVASYQPDLIVLNNSHYAENGVYEQYAKIAPTYVFRQAASDLDSTLRKLGELLGKAPEAEQALADYRQKVETARAKLAPVSEGKKAVIIRMNAKGMFLMGGDYFGGFVLAEDLGFGKSKLVEQASSAPLSLELLPELDADYIFIANHANTGDAYYKELTGSPLWQKVPAVQQDRVFQVEDDSWLNGGLLASGNVVDEVVRLLAP
ncbi:ABC transporter substrate-binding protein [Cohnella hongkongensis]|uniref:ABC transporter substrate-binding protein n=1 Tax=Cohnella hongkongensis TaxID=178337 RepID=A0ABV9F8F6_9BACL